MSKQALTPGLVHLAWNAWSELGISAWRETRASWFIDPEPLILLTASLSDQDERLREESLAWCSKNRQLLSKGRLQRLRKDWPGPPVAEAYLASLWVSTSLRGEPAGAAPGDSSPKSVTASRLPRSPASLSLRLRAALGVGARTEIIRVLLMSGADVWRGTAELAEICGYTKRNIAEIAESQHASGILEKATKGSQVRYRLAAREPLRQMFEPTPDGTVDFFALCRGLSSLTRALDEQQRSAATVRSVQARQAFSECEPFLRRTGLRVPHPEPGQDAWTILHDWAAVVLDGIVSSGEDLLH